MKDFVVYHNTEAMGYFENRQEGEPFGLVTKMMVQ
jgi:hypothetical protein